MLLPVCHIRWLCKEKVRQKEAREERYYYYFISFCIATTVICHKRTIIAFRSAFFVVEEIGMINVFFFVESWALHAALSFLLLISFFFFSLLFFLYMFG